MRGRGFTLVEIIAVLVIMAIAAAALTFAALARRAGASADERARETEP